MKVIFAYLIVVLLSQFPYSISVMIFSPLFGFIFIWVPKKIRILLSGFFSGFISPISSVLFSYLIFNLIFGITNHSTGRIFASLIPLLIPIKNDFKKYNELKDFSSSPYESVANEASLDTFGLKCILIGSISSIISIILLVIINNIVHLM